MTHIKRLCIALMAMLAEGFITIVGILIASDYGNAYMIHGFSHDKIIIGYFIILVGTLLSGTLANVNFTFMALRHNRTKKDE